MVKKSTGIMLDIDVIRELDHIVKDSVYLGVTRSEVINAVLLAFLNSEEIKDKTEKVRELVMLVRKGKLK